MVSVLNTSRCLTVEVSALRRVAGLGIAVCLLSLHESAAASADEPHASKGQMVESLTTALIHDALIPARESGTLRGLHDGPGQYVTTTDDIGSLDDDRQKLAVRSANLALTIAMLKAEDQLPRLTALAKVREASQLLKELEVTAQISQLKANSDLGVQLAEKSREVAEFELDRARKAREAFEGSVSAAELNRLQVLFDQKTLEIAQRKEDLTVARLQPAADAASVEGQKESVARATLEADEEDQLLKIAAASRDAAEAELQIAQSMLERRRLVVPFDGLIVDVLRQPGEWVEAGTPVYRIIQLDRLRVEGFVNATLAASLSPGQSVTIRFAPESGLPEVPGALSFISPEVDPVNNQVRIQAEFPNPQRRIRPGLIASLHIEPARKPAP
jgi:multidrug efflux pump subunit AcrA (membrane-fusion protein)